MSDDPILEYLERFMDGFRRNDKAAVLSLFSENGIMMPSNEPSIYGKKELEEWYDEYFSAFRVLTFEKTERDVTLLGDWAIERWSYLVAIQSVNGDDRIRDDGRALSVWKKEGDHWRIAQTMFNSIRPIGGATSRFLVRMKSKS